MLSLVEHVEAFASRAFQQYSERDLQGALRSLGRALQIDPGCEFALMMRGHIWLETNHPRLAIRDLDVVIVHNPESISAYLRRAEARRSMGQPHAALRDCEQILLRDETNPTALHLRAGLKTDLRRFPEALEDLDRLVEFHPDHLKGRIDRGFVRFILGDLQGARTEFGTVMVSSDPAEENTVALARVLFTVVERTIHSLR
ncbi:MAG TPA: hypothetical protein VE981_22130 [Planctomycetota bacterium]|nr:hypothetical protein [Planctomycetota bacterium]